MISAPPVLELELPYPPAALSPNAREHWGSIAKAKAEYKSAVFTLAKNKKQLAGMAFPLKGPVTVILTFVLPDKRRHDWVNLYGSVKSLEDAIVEAGILVDDNVGYITHVGLAVEYGKKAAVRVRLVGS